MSSSASPNASSASSGDAKNSDKKGMTIEEFRIYDSMASRMDAFVSHLLLPPDIREFFLVFKSSVPLTLEKHNHFRMAFCERLTMHHGIEEEYFFPKLAKKMPEFRAELGIPEDGETGEGRGELLTQHDVIHQGLEGFQAYLEACQDGEQELHWTTLRSKMEGWGEVLWTHLDQEVATLRAENMRKYWTVEEMIEMSGM